MQVSPSELIPGEILASYDAFEVLASDIRDDMIRESATPDEWEEAVNTKVTDIQEGLVYEEQEKRRRYFLLTAFNRLNEKGQKKAIEAVENMLFVPDYRNNEKLLGEDIRPDNKKEGKAPGQVLNRFRPPQRKEALHMATITKRGDTYRIRCSLGYDSQGKQVIRSTTWKPDPGMTPKQAEKELNRFAVLFEEKCKSGGGDPPYHL